VTRFFARRTRVLRGCVGPPAEPLLVLLLLELAADRPSSSALELQLGIVDACFAAACADDSGSARLGLCAPAS
jgi:hypothetical protein